MNVRLEICDSKIPNLAAMKVSRFFKDRDINVGPNVVNPDQVWIFKVFRKDSPAIEEMKWRFPSADKFIGGSGIDLNTTLPFKMEFLKPDYDLYPQTTYSQGRTTYGCIRSCYFCDVPKKEGKLIRWQHPREFHDDRFKEIMIMDNNWLADREWFLETSQWIIGKKLKLREHGLDARLMTKEFAEQIAKFKLAAPLHFAFDNDRDQDAVEKCINLLNDAGVHVRNQVRFYVYVHDDSQYDSGVYRCRWLKKHNAMPFVMVNMDKEQSQRVKDLQRWAALGWIFWKCDIADYNRQ